MRKLPSWNRVSVLTTVAMGQEQFRQTAGNEEFSASEDAEFPDDSAPEIADFGCAAAVLNPNDPHNRQNPSHPRIKRQVAVEQ